MIRLASQQDVPCEAVTGEHPEHYYCLDNLGETYDISSYVKDPTQGIYYCDGTESEQAKRERLAREALWTLRSELLRPFERVARWLSARTARRDGAA